MASYIVVKTGVGDNLSPVYYQTITWTNADLSSIWFDLQRVAVTEPMATSLMAHRWYSPFCDSFLNLHIQTILPDYCPASRTTLVATRFWVVMICPIIKCLTVLEFSFILFDLCLFITIFNFILNYVPIVTFWIFTYHKIWILLIIFCFIWSYWIIYFSTSLEVFWSVVS